MLRIFALAGMLGLVATLAQAEPVGLAVLEDVSWDEGGARQIYEPRLRALFVSDKGRWRPAATGQPELPKDILDKQPFPLVEFVSADSKPFQFIRQRGTDGGRLVTSGFLPKSDLYGVLACCDRGWLKIDPQALYADGSRMSNFLSPINAAETRAPMPLSSKEQTINDPEHWRPLKLKPALRADSANAVLAKFAGKQLCVQRHKMPTPEEIARGASEFPPPPGSGKHIPIRISANADELVVLEAYQNARKERLLKVKIGPKFVQRCQRRNGEAIFTAVAWVSEPSGISPVAHAFATGATVWFAFNYPLHYFDLKLIEIADFDGDGKSEALLNFIDQKGHDFGYVLLQDRMTNSVPFRVGGRG